MKLKGLLMGVLLICGALPLLGAGSLPREQFERTVPLAAPMAAGETFFAETYNGSITVHESGENTVRVAATITAEAVDVQKARELAGATTVALVPGNGGIKVKVESPDTGRNQSVWVDMDIFLPAEGTVDVRSYNGNIDIRDTTGTVDIETYNGCITCTDISGDITLNSYNGQIRAAYRETADPVCDIAITTYNGGIELLPPPDFSATARILTHNGAVTTRLPLSVTGNIGRQELRGTIGSGKGQLFLESYNGAIEIR